MRDLANTEKVLPCLLDRLTDEDPGVAVESRNQRIISSSRYLKSVFRDLEWLLNVASYSPESKITDEFSEKARKRGGNAGEKQGELYPEVNRSVLAYGIPDLCGRLSATLDMVELEKELEEAIRRYEPRINPRTLRVRSIPQVNEKLTTSLSFEIEGDLWMESMPEHLHLKTAIDLETGQCVSLERSNG